MKKLVTHIAIVLVCTALLLFAYGYTTQHAPLSADDFTLASGWNATLYASNFSQPVGLAFGEREPVLFIATADGTITAVRAVDGDGDADLQFVFVKASNAQALSVNEGDLYALTPTQTIRYPEAEGHIALGTIAADMSRAAFPDIVQPTFRNRVITLVGDGTRKGPTPQVVLGTQVIASGWRSGFVTRGYPVTATNSTQGIFVADSQGTVWLFTKADKV